MKPNNDKGTLTVKKIQACNKEQLDAIEKKRSVFRACFSTQAGQEVLSFLKNKFLDKPVCKIDNVYFGYIREGQNDVVREIVRLTQK